MQDENFIKQVAQKVKADLDMGMANLDDKIENLQKENNPLKEKVNLLKPNSKQNNVRIFGIQITDNIKND